MVLGTEHILHDDFDILGGFAVGMFVGPIGNRLVAK
jgi:hypothetical protein